jgi:hypothetical protein
MVDLKEQTEYVKRVAIQVALQFIIMSTMTVCNRLLLHLQKNNRLFFKVTECNSKVIFGGISSLPKH